MRTDHAFDLTRCSHGLDLGLRCCNCTTEGLGKVQTRMLLQKRCHGCGRPVGPWVDYCALCTCEDESDCW
jgi:hypothetical protein